MRAGVVVVIELSYSSAAFAFYKNNCNFRMLVPLTSDTNSYSDTKNCNHSRLLCRVTSTISQDREELRCKVRIVLYSSFMSDVPGSFQSRVGAHAMGSEPEREPEPKERQDERRPRDPSHPRDSGGSNPAYKIRVNFSVSETSRSRDVSQVQ